MTEAEVRDLQECSEMFDFSGFLPEEDKRLIAEVVRLRAALRQYGRHLPFCGHGHCSANPCTCGLDKALEGEG